MPDGSVELKMNELSIDQLKQRFVKLQSGGVKLSVPMTYNLFIHRGYSNFLLNMAFISSSEVENIYIS